MKPIFKDSKKLLAKKIDKLALSIGNEYPSFFKEYSRVREEQLQEKFTGKKHHGIDNQNQKNKDSEVKSPEGNLLTKRTPKPAAQTEP